MSKISQDVERRALSIAEAARATNLSRATIHRLVQRGKPATVKIGSRRLVRPEAIDALLTGGAQ